MPRGIYRGRRPFGKYSDLLRRPTGRPIGQRSPPRQSRPIPSLGMPRRVLPPYSPGVGTPVPTPAPRRPLPPKPHPGAPGTPPTGIEPTPGISRGQPTPPGYDPDTGGIVSPMARGRGGTPPPVMGTSWLSGQKPPMLPRGQRPAFKRGVPVDIMARRYEEPYDPVREDVEEGEEEQYDPIHDTGYVEPPPQIEEEEEVEEEEEEEEKKDKPPVVPITPTTPGTPDRSFRYDDVISKYGFPPMEDSPKGLDIWQEQLSQPLLMKTGLSGRERQGIYNLQRRQTQGATAAAAERMREMMGGRGFRMGESGVADTAVGEILSGGAERMGKFAQEQALTERQLRFKEAALLSGMNLQRMGMGQQGQVGLEGIRADRYRTAAHERLGVAGLGWDVEKFGAGLDWDKERYGMGLDWEKERYGSEFGYRSKYDATNWMMDLYRMMYGSQESAWDRYADQYGRQSGGY